MINIKSSEAQRLKIIAFDFQIQEVTGFHAVKLYASDKCLS